MALETQLLPIPISGGLAESQDPTSVAPGSFLALDNLVYDRTGALRRRSGYQALASTSAAVYALSAFDSELVGVDGRGALYTLRPDTDALTPRATVAPATLARSRAVRSHDHVSSGHQVVWGEYIVTTYSLFDLMPEEDRGLFWRVTDRGTGALIVPDSHIPGSFTGGWAAVEHMAFTAGSRLCVVWREPGEDDNSLFRILTWETPCEAPASASYATDEGNVSSWDACAHRTETSLYLVYALSGEVHVAHLGLDGATIISRTIESEEGFVDRVSIAAASPTAGATASPRIGIMCAGYISMSGTEYTVVLRCIGAVALADMFTATLSDLAEPYYRVRQVSCVLDDDATFWCVWEALNSDFSAGATWACSVAPGGVITPMKGVSPDPQVLWHLALASRPWVLPDGRVCVWCANSASPSGAERYIRGGVLVCLSDRTEHTLRVDGTHSRVDAFQSDIPLLPVVQRLGDAVFAAPFLVHVTDQKAGLDVILLDFSPQQAGLWGTSQLAGLLHHTGSMLSAYDGTTAVESGFFHSPIIMSAQTHDDGGLEGPGSDPGMPPAVYGYTAVYAWWDAKGNLHVSEPGPLFTRSISVGSGPKSYTLKIAAPSVTRRGRVGDGEARDVQIWLYRTQANQPENFYQTVRTARVVRGEPFVEIFDDETTVRGPMLYTAGGILETVQPPPMSATCAAKSRLWGVSAEDPKSIWYTQTIVQGEAPRWHPGLSLRIDDSPEGATAIAALDDKVLVFTPSAVYWLAGDGPEDTGAGGSFGGPYLLTTAAGCVDARSVLSYEGGVIFQARAGLFQIGRGLQLSFVGAGVETTLSAYPTVLGTALDKAKGRGIWLVSGPYGSRFLVLDFMHGAGSWMTWTIAEGASHTETAQVVWRGRHVYAGSSLGSTYVAAERDAGVRDVRGLVPVATLETTWIRPDAVLERHQRIRHIVITGRKEGPHIVKVELMTDYDDTVRQVRIFDVVHPFNGPSGLPVERLDVHVAPQKCAALKVRISSSFDGPSSSDEGRCGMLLQGVTVEAGVKQGRAKLAHSNRK